MKKRTIVLSALLMSLALVSCGDNNNNESNKNDDSIKQEETTPENNESTENNGNSETEDVVTYSNAIELYNASVNKMKQTIYEANCYGESIQCWEADAEKENPGYFNPLYIYEKLQHNLDEVYFEKISNGEAIAGVPTAYAQKAYYKGENGRRQSASTKEPWQKFDRENPEKNYPVVNNYGEAVDKTASEIKTEFGKTDSYINFIANENTITSANTFTTNEDGYSFKFDIDLSDGLESAGIAGYNNQVKAMSNKQLKSIKKVEIKIDLNKDLTVKKVVSDETYVVFALSPALSMPNLCVQVHNVLNYTFKYQNTPFEIEKF